MTAREVRAPGRLGQPSGAGARSCLAAAVLVSVAGLACMQTVVLERPPIDGGPSGGGGAGGGGGVGGNGNPGSDGGPVWCSSGPFVSLSPVVRSLDVVIALDRSSSMNSHFGDWTRLVGTQQALHQMLLTYQKAIRFGYEEFPVAPSSSCPDASGCCAGKVDPLPAPQNQIAVDRATNACASMPGGCIVFDASPAGNAIRRARDFYNSSDDHVSDRYVLLLTDGEPTCAPDGNPDPDAVCYQAKVDINNLRVGSGVQTIIFGIGEDIGTPTCLDDMALAGGMQQPVGPSSKQSFYYPARDPSSLSMYLNNVMTGLAKAVCHINLRSPPADTSSVQVLISGKPVMRDPNNRNGWNFDPGSSTRITAFGSACDLLQATDSNDVEVLGCPMGPQH